MGSLISVPSHKSNIGDAVFVEQQSQLALGARKLTPFCDLYRYCVLQMMQFTIVVTQKSQVRSIRLLTKLKLPLDLLPSQSRHAQWRLKDHSFLRGADSRTVDEPELGRSF